MIEPVIEAFTTSKSPRGARDMMISSAALPKVALSRPPIALADAGRELLRGKAEQAGQRDDGDAGNHEAEQRCVGAAVMDPDGGRDRDKQPGQWRLGQHASQCLHGSLPVVRLPACMVHSLAGRGTATAD